MQYRTVGRYAVPYINRMLTNITKYRQHVNEYCQFLQERSLLRRACRNSFDEFGLWATRCTDLSPICIRMHPYESVCTRMHPYASIRLIYASGRQCSTHFPRKSQKSQKCRNRNILIAFCTARSSRIQSNIHCNKSSNKT